MRSPLGPRKQRTRQHVIADQGVNHAERFVIDAGHTAQRVVTDYGYDLVVMTFDGQGYAEPGLIFLQVKASEELPRSGDGFAFDIDVRDYNLWRAERLPVILGLFDAKARKAYWVHVQEYFEAASRRPRKGAKTVRIYVPRGEVLTRRAVERMRAIKANLVLRLAG